MSPCEVCQSPSLYRVSTKTLLKAVIFSLFIIIITLDSIKVSTNKKVVVDFIEEMKLQERLIPSDKVDLKDCIGQGQSLHPNHLGPT